MLYHTGTILLRTPRLLLRPFCLEDAQDMFDNWASREEVTHYTPWPPYCSVEKVRERIEQWRAQYENPAVYHWAVVCKENGQAIGSVSVQALRETHRSCEIGYCLGNDYWNRGIATEALRAVLQLLFETVGMHRVQALHHLNNPASERVMEKAGMRFEGVLRDFGQYADGTWYSLCVHSILEHERCK